MILIVLQILIGLMTTLGVLIIIFTKNIVHAAYALALALIGVAGMYVFLQAELLAVVQILLYAGGVVILLSFGVMLTNRQRGEKLISEGRNKVLGAFVSISVFSILCYLISLLEFNKDRISSDKQIEQIGVSFLTDHIVAFELIAFVLLVALVGAAYLAKQSANE